MTSIGIIGGILTAVAFGFPSVAVADWDYTHWGMTPEQVAAASSGAVKVLPAPQRTRNEEDHWEIAADGSHVDGPLSLHTGFMFDTQGGGLKCVMYNAFGAEVEALRMVLTKRYGKALDESSFASTQTLTWRTPDNIDFAAGERPVAAVVTHCAPNAH